MESSADIPCNSFFKTLKDGISSIQNNISEIEKQMKIPLVELSEDKALIKLVDSAEEIEKMKVSGNEMVKKLDETNERNLQYFNHMESFVDNIEERVGTVIARLKDFGYIPLPTEEVLPEPETLTSVSTVENLNLDLKHTDDSELNNNNITDALLLKTPVFVNSNFIAPAPKASYKNVPLFQSLKHIDSNNLKILETDDSSISMIPDSSSTFSSDITTSTYQSEVFIFDNNGKAEESRNDTPEAPIITSQKKHRNLEDQELTPEDPNRYFYNNQQNNIPGTPKTPVLISHFQRP